MPPLFHGAGSALLTRRPQPDGATQVIRTPNRAASCGVHLVPLPVTGEHYLGATNFITSWLPAGPAVGSAETLIHALREEIDGTLAASQLTGWLWGRRLISLVCFPLIGPCSVAGLLFATGTYRDGFHCSPVIARHLADHVLTPGPPGRRLAWFTPERAPVETMTVAQSITETAAHAAETAHEHGLVLPFFLDDAPVTAYVEQQAGRLYGQLEHPVALPPDILFLAFVLADRGPVMRRVWLAPE
ncbi:FAD-dependent oxidoreductase [Streptomyces noursei]